MGNRQRTSGIWPGHGAYGIVRLRLQDSSRPRLAVPAEQAITWNENEETIRIHFCHPFPMHCHACAGLSANGVQRPALSGACVQRCRQGRCRPCRLPSRQARQRERQPEATIPGRCPGYCEIPWEESPVGLFPCPAMSGRPRVGWP